VDAVHLLTPVSTHADLTVAALDAGKHVACAVPLATSLDDLRRVVSAQARSGRTYMMMETAAFARELRAVRRDALEDLQAHPLARDEAVAGLRVDVVSAHDRPGT